MNDVAEERANGPSRYVVAPHSLSCVYLVAARLAGQAKFFAVSFNYLPDWIGLVS